MKNSMIKSVVTKVTLYVPEGYHLYDPLTKDWSYRYDEATKDEMIVALTNQDVHLHDAFDLLGIYTVDHYGKVTKKKDA